MGPVEFRRFLDRRLLQYCQFHPTYLYIYPPPPFFPTASSKLTNWVIPEHMDDILLHDHRRALLVAVLAVRLDRLLFRRLFHLRNRANRRNLPHRIPRHSPFVIRHLGIPMACLQPRSHGLRVVRRADVDRRVVYLSHDHLRVDVVRKCPKHLPR